MNKVPNVSIVTANVQRLHDGRKRLTFFSKIRSNPGNIYLLNETGPPTAAQAAQWNQECLDVGLASLFTPGNNTAIVWKPSPIIITTDDEQPNLLHDDFGQFSSHLSDMCFTIGSTVIRTVAIYVPAYGQLKKPYLQSLNDLLRRHRDSYSLVIGGDWNCVENPAIDQEDHGHINRYEAPPMRHLVAAHSLSDSFRVLNPKKRVYTNDPKAGRAQRRLDRIYLSSDLVPLIKSCSNWIPIAKSTHVPVATRLWLPGAVDIGPGKFKLGTHIFTALPTQKYITTLVDQLFSSATLDHPDDPLAAWTVTKAKLQPFLQNLSQGFGGSLTQTRRRRHRSMEAR
jgi:hypothetical protein